MINKAKKHRIFKRDKYRCLRCGSVKNLTIDHIRPKCKNGNNATNNLQTLCVLCNNGKDDQIIDYRGNNVYIDRRLLITEKIVVGDCFESTKTRINRAEQIVKTMLSCGENIGICQAEFKRLSGLKKMQAMKAFSRITI